MFDNLLIDPIRAARRCRRRFVLFVGGAAGFFVGVLIFSLPPRGELTEVSAAFRVLSAAREHVFAGGDIPVDPPIHPPPPPPPAIPERVGSGAPPILSTESFMVKDHASGAVLWAWNEYALRPIASMTKLMTALILLERGPLLWEETAAVVSDDIIDTHMYAGDVYTLKDLWYAMLVGSSNKAAWTLVDASLADRPGFVERMNAKTLELGMTNTVFQDATGLSDGNVSTASDIAILFSEAMRHDGIRTAMTTREYELFSKERNKKHRFWNTNWLLLGWVPHSFAEIRGGKTGYIPASGYNVAVEIAAGGGRALDVVVLGAENNEARFEIARDMAQWVFENFQWPPQLNF